MDVWGFHNNVCWNRPLGGSVLFLFQILSLFFFFKCFRHQTQFLTDDFLFCFFSLGETSTALHRRRSHRCWIAFHFPFLSTSSWIHKSRLMWEEDRDNHFGHGWKRTKQTKLKILLFTRAVRLLLKSTSVPRHLMLLILYLLKVKNLYILLVFLHLWG